MLPAQFCFYQGSILSAVQYAKGRFVIPSLAPVVYNVMIILGGVLLASRIGMTGFAVGVLVGAFVGNLLLQVYGAYRADARFTPNLNLRHPGFLLFLRLSIPIMLALSLAFTDDWIIRWFGSYLQPASITWLSYAKTLMRVPLGVVGQGVGVASFPFLAQLYSEGKFDELNRLLNSTLKGLIAAPRAHLRADHRGKRARSSTWSFPTRACTARPRRHRRHAGLLLAGNVCLGRAVHPGPRLLRHAQHLVPAIVGTVLTFANLPLYWLLVRHSQHLGLAMASSLGITVYTVVLFVLLNRRTHNREEGAMVLFFLKVCARFGRGCRGLPPAANAPRATLRLAPPDRSVLAARDCDFGGNRASFCCGEVAGHPRIRRSTRPPAQNTLP